MFHHPATTGTAGDDQSAQAAVIDQNRLRAAARLIFDGETADRIVVGAGSTSVETTIKCVVSAVLWEWRSAGIQARLRRHTRDDVERPLGPRSGLPARGAVTLALHLGLGLQIETISRATSTGAGQLGNDLYQARLRLEPRINPACAQFVSSIGRYRDGSLDIGARATLIQHAQHCPACRNALDRFQALDARLLDRIEQERAMLPPLTEQPAPSKLARVRQPLALVAALVLVVVLLGAGGYAIATGRSHAAESAASGHELRGWLLTSDIAGNVTALSLATGKTRSLDTPSGQVRYTGYWPSSTALSPNGKLIANQLASMTQTPFQELVIMDLKGNEQNRIRMTDPFIHFSGWLGNDTVLEISEPPQEPGESADDYFTRSRTHSSLIGVDIKTGNQHELYKGAVAYAYPSPDASMIALVSRSVQSNSGFWTIELRPIKSGRVGDPIKYVTSQVVPGQPTTPDGFSGTVVWSPDSSLFYTAINEEPETASTPTPDSTASPVLLRREAYQLVSVARDGTITPVPEPLDDATNAPFAVSPDGLRLIVESTKESGTTRSGIRRFSELTLSSGIYRTLTDWSPYVFQSSVWSPDGSTMLTYEWRPFMIPTSDVSGAFELPARVDSLVVLPQQGEGYVALTRMDGEIGTNFFAWLPEDAISEPEPGPMPVRLSQPEPVELSQANLSVETSAQVSGGGDFVILHDSVGKKSVIWDRAKNDGRDLPPNTHDLSWFPHTSAVIGVTTARFNQAGAPSRLGTFASTFSVSLPSYDYRVYDPADIGSSLSKEYATPLMSPNENALAFFVLDTRDHSVNLWLADYNAAPRPVAHWQLPSDNKLSYEPIAGWIDNQTLLFAEPGDWHRGLPGSVQLNLLTVQTDGSSTVETAETLQRHGTERGIAIAELSVNRASGHIAYRLQHFSKASINDLGATDTIAIASADKLSDALEVSRGGSSSGLSWSPDGRILAAVTPGGLQFYSASGDALFGVPNLDHPSDPRWIDQSTLWFNETDDQGTRIMSVTLQ